MVLRQKWINDSVLKMDPDTVLEIFFPIAAVFTGLVSIGAFVMRNNVVAFGFVFVTVALIVLWRTTDNYYLIDMDRKNILYHFDCLGFQKVKEVGRFSDVHVVTVDSCPRSRKRDGNGRVERWSAYVVTVIFKSGERIRVSNWTSRNIGENNSVAQGLAERLNADYLPGEPDKKAHLIESDGHYYIEFKINILGT